MKMYQGTSVLSGEFHRRCSGCSNEWTVKQLSLDNAQENLEAFNRDNDVLCPDCSHFNSVTHACSRFHFNLSSNPNRYHRKCGGRFFERRKEYS